MSGFLFRLVQRGAGLSDFSPDAGGSPPPAVLASPGAAAEPEADPMAASAAAEKVPAPLPQAESPAPAAPDASAVHPPARPEPAAASPEVTSMFPKRAAPFRLDPASAIPTAPPDAGALPFPTSAAPADAREVPAPQGGMEKSPGTPRTVRPFHRAGAEKQPPPAPSIAQPAEFRAPSASPQTRPASGSSAPRAPSERAPGPLAARLQIESPAAPALRRAPPRAGKDSSRPASRSIHVQIGKVEVLGAPVPERLPDPPKQVSPAVLGFEEYLGLRAYPSWEG